MRQGFGRPHLGLVDLGKGVKINHIELLIGLKVHQFLMGNLPEQLLAYPAAALGLFVIRQEGVPGCGIHAGIAY